MADLADSIQSILEPFVGPAIAGMCVRAAAAAANTTPAGLTARDMPVVLETLHHLLTPVAPADVIELVCARIEASVA